MSITASFNLIKKEILYTAKYVKELLNKPWLFSYVLRVL